MVQRSAALLIVCISVFFQASCAFDAIYTSKDLSRLPCETDLHKFFYPIEFSSDGAIVYSDQMHAIARLGTSDARLDESAEPQRDIIIFIHGWDKTSGTAERDYQDFLCRLYWSGISKGSLERGKAALIGVFWPATVLPNYEEFALIKPFTFYRTRARADNLAATGIQKLLRKIIEVSQMRTAVRLHAIGHSFGGRLLINCES
jgi:hypothetical protein